MILKNLNSFRITLILVIILFNINLIFSATDSDLSNNNMSIQINIRDTAELKINFIAVDYTSNNISNFISSSKENIDFINSTYPLAKDKFIPIVSSNINFSSNVGGKLNQIEKLILLLRLYSMGRLEGKDYKRIMGIVQEGWFSQRNDTIKGYSLSLLKTGIVEDSFRHGSAHELAHTIGFPLGLCEEYLNSTWQKQDNIPLFSCPNGDSNPDNGNLDGECLIYPYGCPTETFERLVPWLNNTNSTEIIQMRNFMGPSGNEDLRWVSKDSYNYLLNKFSASEDIEQSNMIILVSGLIDKNGTIIFNSFYTLNETSVLNESDPNGNYSVIIKSGASTYYTHKFEPIFRIENIGGEDEDTNVTAFAILLPFNNSVTKIILQNSTTILAEKNVSNNYPNVSFTTDFTNKFFNNTFTVGWNASDIDNDNLTYAILISDDGGLNYTTLALDINQTNLTIENSFLKNGSNYKVKVLATDGVKTSEAISNSSFSIQPDPNIELIFPTNETRLQTNNVTFMYRTFVLNSTITNCSLFINGVRNLTNSTPIVQDEIMNFTKVLVNDNYNWAIRCGDSQGYIGETHTYELNIGNVTTRIIDILSLEEQEFGKNVSINVSLTMPENVSLVTLNITNPNGTVYSYNLTNISSNVWRINNFTDNVNGTYNFTFYVSYNDNISVSGSDIFVMVEEITNLKYCSILDKENTIYYLQKDVQSQATCFNITAHNITLEGMNNVVHYAENSKGHGIYTIGYNNITINNIEIRMNNKTLTDNRGIYFVNSKYNKIANSTLVIKGANNTDVRNHAIELRNTSDSIISNNEVISYNQRGYGIYLQAQIKENSGNNLVEDNVITTYRNLEFGVYVHGVNGGDSTGTNITNNSIRAYGFTSYGIFIEASGPSSTDSNILQEDSIITSGTAHGIRIIDSSHNFIKDSNISASNENDVEILSGTNNTFLNVTYIDEFVSGNFTRKWYLNVKVNATNGSDISQANVSGFNRTYNQQFSELTNSTGEINKKELIEYIINGGNKVYYTNYTINVTKSGFDSPSQSVNLTINKYLAFTLSSANDSFKYSIKDNSGNTVAWLGNQGNIVLKGSCFSGGHAIIQEIIVLLLQMRQIIMLPSLIQAEIYVLKKEIVVINQ